MKSPTLVRYHGSSLLYSMLLYIYDVFLLQKLHLRDNNISRYNAEFVELKEIGSGEFGSVFKCLNRLGN